jgi:hypothetical protein
VKHLVKLFRRVHQSIQQEVKHVKHFARYSLHWEFYSHTRLSPAFIPAAASSSAACVRESFPYTAFGQKSFTCFTFSVFSRFAQGIAGKIGVKLFPQMLHQCFTFRVKTFTPTG